MCKNKQLKKWGYKLDFFIQSRSEVPLFQNECIKAGIKKHHGWLHKSYVTQQKIFGQWTILGYERGAHGKLKFQRKFNGSIRIINILMTHANYHFESINILFLLEKTFTLVI